jgi:hypothetical protein
MFTPIGRFPLPSSSLSRAAPSSDKSRAPSTHSATRTAQKQAVSASSVASIGRTRDVQCHWCKGYGLVQHDCPSKCVLIVKDDGEYSSASDFDKDTNAFLMANHAGSEEQQEEHTAVDDAERYESLIVQRVLSTQMEKAEQNQ